MARRALIERCVGGHADLPSVRSAWLGRVAQPEGDGQLAALEMLDDAAVEARPPSRPVEHRLVGEAEPDMGVAAAQLLALVRREIDDQQPPPGSSSRAASATAAAGFCA